MLYFGNSSRETRWVTFPVEEIQAELVEGHVMKLSEIDHRDMRGIEEFGAEALMAGLVDKKEKVVGWARDKYILFVGKSPYSYHMIHHDADLEHSLRRKVSRG